MPSPSFHLSMVSLVRSRVMPETACALGATGVAVVPQPVTTPAHIISTKERRIRVSLLQVVLHVGIAA